MKEAELSDLIKELQTWAPEGAEGEEADLFSRLEDFARVLVVWGPSPTVKEAAAEYLRKRKKADPFGILGSDHA